MRDGHRTPMRTRRRKLMLSAAAVLAAAALSGAPPAGASVAVGASCPPIPTAQLHAILGFPQSLQTRNTVGNAGGADHYLCNGVAWSGSTPMSFQASLQKAKSGHGAAFGIEAWTPDKGSALGDEWPDNYDELTGGFDKAAVTFPGFLKTWPSKQFTPTHFGYQTNGIVTRPPGVAKGLVAAVGCWWNDDALSAVCLMVEEAVGKPVVAHLNQLAKITVPKVL